MNVSKRILLAGVSMILVVGLVACDKPGPAERAGKSIDQSAEKAGVALDDTAITAKVKAAILAEPGLKTLQISTDTTKGVVTLSGSADSQQSSERAKEIASAVAGVMGVENHLVVKPDK